MHHQVRKQTSSKLVRLKNQSLTIGGAEVHLVAEGRICQVISD